MNVLAFERKQGAEAWSEAELNILLSALSGALASENGRGWETGVTEKGDRQFYLLGPLPDQACELCVSRIGGRYILEDGSGRLLFEHQKPRPCRAAREGRDAVRRGRDLSHAWHCCGVRFGT